VSGITEFTVGAWEKRNSGGIWEWMHTAGTPNSPATWIMPLSSPITAAASSIASITHSGS
jgi:hypothetical protein